MEHRGIVCLVVIQFFRTVSALGKLSVEQFMALTSSDEEAPLTHSRSQPRSQPHSQPRSQPTRKRKRKGEKGPGWNNTGNLEVCGGSASEASDVEEEDVDCWLGEEGQWMQEEGELPTDEEDDDDDVGVVEPRPPNVTSWRERVRRGCVYSVCTAWKSLASQAILMNCAACTHSLPGSQAGPCM